MSASSVSRTGSVARIVAAFVAVAAISCAAKDGGSPASAAATAQRDGVIGQACLGRAPTQVLSLRNGKDASVSLAYFRGCGWRYLPVRQTMAQPLSEPGEMRRVSASLSAALPPDEPLTVFIDGPTGYTFVWVRDAGWKFVGQMAGQEP